MSNKTCLLCESEIRYGHSELCEIGNLQSKLAAQSVALKKYGQHLPLCQIGLKVTGFKLECNCGLKESIAEVQN